MKCGTSWDDFTNLNVQCTGESYGSSSTKRYSDSIAVASENKQRLFEYRTKLESHSIMHIATENAGLPSSYYWLRIQSVMSPGSKSRGRSDKSSIIVGMSEKVVNTLYVWFNYCQRVLKRGPYDAQNKLLRFNRQVKPFSAGRTSIRPSV